MKKLIDYSLFALQIKCADRYKRYLDCKWYQIFKKEKLYAEAQELEKIIEEKKKQTDEPINHSIY